MQEQTQNSAESLERIARAARVSLLTYQTCSAHPKVVLTDGVCPQCKEERRPGQDHKNRPVTSYFAYQHGLTIGVFSTSRKELKELLLAFRAAKQLGRTDFAAFAGCRGFTIKCVRQAD